jgi:hypothetical protein
MLIAKATMYQWQRTLKQLMAGMVMECKTGNVGVE